MAMCLKIFYKSEKLTLVSAFENGFVSVHYLDSTSEAWIMTYRSQAHSQPVLSLDVHPDHEYFVTSSADSIIAKHPIPHSPQEIIETTSKKTSKKTSGNSGNAPNSGSVSALSEGLSGKANHFSVKTQEWKDPIKTINTKHSGQQSLSMRSDGRIFATAGWDSNVRVYSSKTLKEMAVLQWHKVGAYAVAFSNVQTAETAKTAEPTAETTSGSTSTANTSVAVTTVKERRLRKAKDTHWIATGSKDGKVALWDIY